MILLTGFYLNNKSLFKNVDVIYNKLLYDTNSEFSVILGFSLPPISSFNILVHLLSIISYVYSIAWSLRLGEH